MADDTNILPNDQNFIRAAGFESSSTPGLVMAGQIDEITGRVLVDSAGGSGTVTSISQGTGLLLSTNPLIATGTVSLATSLQPMATLTGKALQFLRVNAGETAVEYAAVAGGGITVGTTTITSGTNTRILYNNSGVVGEYTLTGSGTVVAMQTAPTFATSISTPSVLATANDSGAIGASGTAFSDLFLASGAVINFNAGASTITHSANTLTIGGSGATTLALGTNSLTMTGSIASTGARITKGWFTDIESTNMPTVGGTSLSSTFAALAGSTSQAFSVSTLDIGNADTTLSRVSAGVVAIEGVNIVTAGAVTTNGITMSTAKLLGRTTASTGAIEEISVGAGLTLSGGSLTATGGGATDIQIFTSTGANTWTKPSGAVAVEVLLWGGGGAGANGDTSNGGAGGGGGQYIRWIFPASSLGSTETVTIGAGGTSAFSDGSNSTFGTHLTAYGGGGAGGGQASGGGGAGSAAKGQTGQNSANSSGGAPASTAGAVGIAGQGAGGVNTADGKCAEWGGGAGGGGSTSAISVLGGSSLFASPGGGGGGGGGSDGVGYAGGTIRSYTAGGGGTAGATSGGAGGAGTSRSGSGKSGDGGGGGGSKSGGTGGAGGAGGVPGGGGGGGGRGSSAGGAFGAGARGECIVITYV